MNALFNRRIYKHFGLLRDRLATARHYSSVRALKTLSSRYHGPFFVGCASCPVFYSNARRHFADDVHSHKDRFETAADGRWSNRCNCCGLNSKGQLIGAVIGSLLAPNKQQHMA